MLYCFISPNPHQVVCQFAIGQTNALIINTIHMHTARAVHDMHGVEQYADMRDGSLLRAAVGVVEERQVAEMCVSQCGNSLALRDLLARIAQQLYAKQRIEHLREA